MSQCYTPPRYVIHFKGGLNYGEAQGYDARIFAHQFPSELAGLLLLDVSHPDQNARESAASNKDRDDFMIRQAWYGRLAPFGITRLLGRCEFHPQDCSRSFRTTLKEYDAFTNISPTQVRATGNLGDLALIDQIRSACPSLHWSSRSAPLARDPWPANSAIRSPRDLHLG